MAGRVPPAGAELRRHPLHVWQRAVELPQQHAVPVRRAQVPQDHVPGQRSRAKDRVRGAGDEEGEAGGRVEHGRAAVVHVGIHVPRPRRAHPPLLRLGPHVPAQLRLPRGPQIRAPRRPGLLRRVVLQAQPVPGARDARLCAGLLGLGLFAGVVPPQTVRDRARVQRAGGLARGQAGGVLVQAGSERLAVHAVDVAEHGPERHGGVQEGLRAGAVVSQVQGDCDAVPNRPVLSPRGLGDRGLPHEKRRAGGHRVVLGPHCGRWGLEGGQRGHWQAVPADTRHAGAGMIGGTVDNK